MSNRTGKFKELIFFLKVINGVTVHYPQVNKGLIAVSTQYVFDDGHRKLDM